MAGMTADQIVDRVRSICASPPFSFVEALSWDSFEFQPSTNIDGAFRIEPPSSQAVEGRFDYSEDRTDSMPIHIARKRNGDFNAVRRVLLRDMHSLTAAIVRDGLRVSGDYVVPDAGRGHSIEDQSGKDYVTLRLTLPIHYESQL